jgi:hypothetical protein
MADPAKGLNEASARAERSLEQQLSQVVGAESFSRLLAEAMGTTMGLVRLWTDCAEMTLRLVRLPSRGELTRVTGQIGLVEDKLEDVLIAVERLEQRLDGLEQAKTAAAPARRAAERGGGSA